MENLLDESPEAVIGSYQAKVALRERWERYERLAVLASQDPLCLEQPFAGTRLCILTDRPAPVPNKFCSFVLELCVYEDVWIVTLIASSDPRFSETDGCLYFPVRVITHGFPMRGFGPMKRAVIEYLRVAYEHAWHEREYRRRRSMVRQRHL